MYLDEAIADKIKNAPSLAGTPPIVIKEALALAWAELEAFMSDTLEPDDITADLWERCESCRKVIRIQITGQWVYDEEGDSLPFCTTCAASDSPVDA